MGNVTDSPTGFDPLRASVALFGVADRHDGVRVYRSTDVASADDQGLLGVVAHIAASGGIRLDADADVMLSTLLGRATEEAVELEARTAASVEVLGGACLLYTSPSPRDRS